MAILRLLQQAVSPGGVSARGHGPSAVAFAGAAAVMLLAGLLLFSV
jgi:hypothetical protein